MGVSWHKRDDLAVITVQGHFNFSLHQAFREASTQALATTDVRTLEVDLSKADYLDSSALGMLLVLREQAEKVGVTHLRIHGAHGAVHQVLSIAKFETFYEIE